MPKYRSNREPTQSFFLIFLVTSISVNTCGADDWPGWRGQGRDGQSKETGLLDNWPKDGPPLAWKIRDIGNGYSTPAIAQGRIFVMGGNDKGEFVYALNEADGKEIWSQRIGPLGSGGGYKGPRSTPTFDGGFVYSLGSGGDLACFNAENGKSRWQVNLKKAFNGAPGGWMYSESVLIDGPHLICTPGGNTATVVALDKKTGKPAWKGSAPGGNNAQYASPIIATVGKNKQYVTFLSGALVAMDARSGKFQWSYKKSANGTANCSTAVFSNGHVFSASGYGTGAGLVKLVGGSKGSTATEVYFTKELINHHGGFVLVNGNIYGTNERSLVCLDYLTGEVRWKERCVGKGSTAFADGHLYVRSENGPIALVKANHEKFEEVGRFNQPDRSDAAAWPHPVIANGKLYLRDQDLLLCYNIKRD